MRIKSSTLYPRMKKDIMERKKRTFENFLSDKIVNLSDSANHLVIKR